MRIFQENIGIRQILIQIELPAHPDIFGGPLGTQKQHFRRTESRFSFRPSFGIETGFFPTFLRFFQRILSFPSLYGSHIHNGIQGQIFFSHKTITLSIHPYHSDQRMIFTGPVFYRTIIQIIGCRPGRSIRVDSHQRISRSTQIALRFFSFGTRRKQTTCPQH